MLLLLREIVFWVNLVNKLVPQILRPFLTNLEVFLINVKVVFFRVAFLHSENAVGNKKAVAEGEY